MVIKEELEKKLAEREVIVSGKVRNIAEEERRHINLGKEIFELMMIGY